MARNEKDALILILDVGMSMATQLVNSTSTYLQTCVDIIQMIIQRKIFQSSKDEIGLILYGTNETANDLWNSETDHYSHIVLARPLCQVDWKLLEYVQNNINSTLLDGDVLDAITVAMDHLHNQSLERKFKEKRIILLTSYSSLSSDENIKEIRDALKSDEIRLDIVSPFSEPDTDFDNTNQMQHQTRNDQYETKEMTREQENNQRILKTLLNDIDGCLYSFSEVLTLLSTYQTKSVKSVGTKYLFEIGETFKLPIVSTILVKENKPDLFKFKKVYAKDEQVELKTDRARFTKDDEQRDLDDKTEVVDAYRYGSTYIPIDNPDTLKYQNEKCFTLLGFTKSENIRPYHYMGDSANEILADVQKCDADQQTSFASMVHAMYEENVYGIVRRVFSKASSPRMGCIIPFVSDRITNGFSLLYYDLPFEDDIRKYTLDNFCLMKKFKPSEAQLELVDNLIDHMNLMTNDDEAFEPKLTFSPYIQRMIQTMAARAIDPDAQLPNFDSHLTRNLVKKTFDDNTKGILKRLNDEFYTRNIDKKKKKLDETRDLFPASNPSKLSDDVDKKNEDEEANINIGIEDIYATLQTGKIRRIGTVNPTKDFKALLATIDPTDQIEFDTLCSQLINLIKEFIIESGNTVEEPNVFHRKSLDCMKLLRDTCLMNTYIGIYNDFLTSLRIYLFESNEHSAGQKSKFLFLWRYVFIDSGLNLNLITTTEHRSSTVHTEEASRFVARPLEDQTNGTTGNDVAISSNEENVEDLLDLM